MTAVSAVIHTNVVSATVDIESATVVGSTVSSAVAVSNPVFVVSVLGTIAVGVTGAGFPSGGTTGQVAVKASDTDYDVEFVDPSVFVQPNAPTGVTGRYLWFDTDAPTLWYEDGN